MGRNLILEKIRQQSIQRMSQERIARQHRERKDRPILLEAEAEKNPNAPTAPPGAAGASSGGGGAAPVIPVVPPVIAGLLAYYDAGDFNNVLKTWADSSGQGFGTATELPSSDNSPELVTVGVGAPYLEVHDSHMNVNKSGPDEWTQFSYTQEVWVNFTTDDQSYPGITDFSPDEEYAMYWTGDGDWFEPEGQMIMSETGFSPLPATGGAPLPWDGGPETGWHHVVNTFYSDGADEANSVLTIYVNGEASVTQTGDMGIGPGANEYLDLCCSGTEGGEVYGMEGQIAYIALYDRAITDGEVLQRYNETKARFGL